MKSHDLKTWPEYFDKIRKHKKKFEIRKNDRDFNEGDLLMLHEWDPSTEKYTGRTAARWVNYVLKDFDGLAPGYVAMSLDIDHPGEIF